MLDLKAILIGSGLIGLLAACSSPTATTPVPTATAPTNAKTEPSKAAVKPSEKSNEKPSEKPSKVNQGGQVVEVGAYHLELVTINEEGGVHIDLFLQNGSDHSPIPDAKVSAQVQLPNGTKKSLDMPYKADGSHYGAFLSKTIAGEYKVVVFSEVKGEKINGRFAFKR